AASIVGLCVSLTAAGCSEKPVEEGPVARPVKLVTIGGSDSVSWVEYPGTIKAAQTADMGFEVPGRIIARPVQEGQRVKKRGVLARLDDRDYVASLDRAKAKLRKAEADYRREQSIYDEDPGATSQARLDTFSKGVEVAEAELRVAQKALDDTVLRAPFDGVMARKLVDDFANVNAKDPVLVFQDDSHLEIQVNIPERDVSGERHHETNEEVTARLKPEVVVTSLPDRSFPAQVKEITTETDPVTRTFQATLIFDNPKNVAVFPGMTAKVRIKSSRTREASDRIAVPTNAAVADAKGNAYVWLVDPSSMTVHRRPVELGELSGSDVEVKSGLSIGDQIAVSGVHLLREGMAVRQFVRQVAQ
ncbi:MAG: efflux RND transporter periplasmic adaptor subunit, partial [Candidatus Methylomirabilales bacterium]